MKKILQLNPEIAKYFWLEFSPQRLITMPSLLFLLTLLIYLMSENKEEAMMAIHYASFYGFVFIGVIWGIKNASDGILDEYNEKTWDWQRRSPVGPWKLALGKLFGPTIYNWYGAMICWAIYMYSATYTSEPIQALKTGWILLPSTIGIHGLIILIALLLVRKNQGLIKIKSNRTFLYGILFLILFSGLFSYFNLFRQTTSDILWFGITFSFPDILFLSCIVYSLWIIYGIFRSMRTALQYENGPMVWLTFHAFHFLFQYGFFLPENTIIDLQAFTKASVLIFLESIFLIYALALSENKEVVQFKQYLKEYRKKEYASLFRNIPLWLLTIPLAKVFGLFALSGVILSGEYTAIMDLLKSLQISDVSFAAGTYVAVLFFMMRDLVVLMLLHISGRPQRADATFILYLLLSYLIIPFLLTGLDMPYLFFPDSTHGQVLLIIMPMLEAFLTFYLLKKKWKFI